MGKHIKIRKGRDIKLVGEADKVLAASEADVYAIRPSDAHGVIPKLIKKAGDEVKAGTAIYYDKNNQSVKFTSPISGEITDIIRGEKRRILEIRILADKEVKFEDFGKANPNELSGDDVKGKILEAGLWPFIKQRPYDIIADPKRNPKAIFISAFDSNPLAADMDFVLKDKEAEFQAGLDALGKLTEGKVHLNIQSSSSKTFKEAKGVEINTISGPHPAGNVGVQIHHIDPINKGEIVWVVNPQDVAAIGTLFLEGKNDSSRVVALAGSSVVKPKYFKTRIGASIKKIVDGNILEGDNRFISGNVLTGTKIPKDGFLGMYDSNITVIPEGNYSQFVGWLTPNFNKLSFSRTMFSWLMPGKKYALDTNKNGEERAFVMTGEYERLFPMDIYPMQLVKSIIVKDLELMENLGIYEVAPEDFALCEFACTSKIELQKVVREGLDLMIKEVG